MLSKAYEVVCDGCGCAEPNYGNRDDVVALLRAAGWIFRGKKHYCSKKCEAKDTEKPWISYV